MGAAVCRRAAQAAAGVAGALLLAGCGLAPLSPEVKKASEDAGYLRCIADDFIDYAVLAAHVYGTSTATDLSKALHGKSIDRDKRLALLTARTRSDSTRMPTEAAVRAGLAEVESSCARLAAARSSGGGPATPPPPEPLPLACSDSLQAALRAQQADDVDTQSYRDDWPAGRDDCEPPDDSERAAVPFDAVRRQAGWEREPDIERYATTREWRVFVPGLAIEVWSRPRADGPAAREYAIVFRGTADSGGWLSDLRILTALLPIFWDQYRQAEWSTRQIVEQIRERELRQWLQTARNAGDLAAFDAGFPDITTVGHSLGAGLAKFVYYRVREVNRVVGFNASPIDGSRSIIGLDERERVMHDKGERHRPVPVCTPRHEGGDPGPPRAPSRAGMNFLYEQGEILSVIAPCQGGAHWGGPGDPSSSCQSVNLSRFDRAHPLRSLFAQHGMNRLACQLALHATVPAGPAPRHARVDR